MKSFTNFSVNDGVLATATVRNHRLMGKKIRGDKEGRRDIKKI